VELVVAELILDPEPDQDRTGESDGEADDVERGKPDVSAERARRDEEVAAKHGGTGWWLVVCCLLVVVIIDPAFGSA